MWYTHLVILITAKFADNAHTYIHTYSNISSLTLLFQFAFAVISEMLAFGLRQFLIIDCAIKLVIIFSLTKKTVLQ